MELSGSWRIVVMVAIVVVLLGAATVALAAWDYSDPYHYYMCTATPEKSVYSTSVDHDAYTHVNLIASVEEITATTNLSRDGEVVDSDSSTNYDGNDAHAYSTYYDPSGTSGSVWEAEAYCYAREEFCEGGVGCWYETCHVRDTE